MWRWTLGVLSALVAGGLVAGPASAVDDTTPPTCTTTLTPGSPSSLTVTFQDTGSGLEGLEPLIVLNNHVPDGPLLVPGMTSPYTLIIGPTDPAVRTEGLVRVFDVAGNSRLCAWVIPVLLECPAQAAGAIVGTPGDDNLVGTAGNDVIFGLGGNDRISGGGGNDIICGGEGNDFLSGDAGDDALLGGHGNDTLAGGLGEDDLFGEAGDDKLAGTDAVVLDYLSGGPHVAGDQCAADTGDAVTECGP